MCEEQGEKSNEGENGDDFDDDSEQQILSIYTVQTACYGPHCHGPSTTIISISQMIKCQVTCLNLHSY